MGTLARNSLVNNAELILGDTGNAIFEATTVGTYIDNAVLEASKYRPNVINRWHTARHKSKYVDIFNDVPSIIEPLYAVYPVLLKDSDGDFISDKDLDYNRRNIEKVGYALIRMELDYAPTAKATDQLTGTVTFTADSTAISGSGTAFTTELRPGYYIRKSGSDNWYRIGSITDDTNLVLSTYVLTADTGADTANKTDYWRNDVILACKTNHQVSIITDLAGAVDSGAAAGYAEGVWSITVDALTDGTLKAGLPFNIAGTWGEYRLTEDATVAANEATIKFEPPLQDRAIEDAVVTFHANTMDEQLERLVVEVAAARLCIDWVYDARTETDSAIANIASAATEVALANPEVDQALSDLDSGRSLINTVTVGANADGSYSNYAQTGNVNAQGYLQTAAAYIREAGGHLQVAGFQAQLRNIGYEKLQMALRELKGLSSPSIMSTYSRG